MSDLLRHLAAGLLILSLHSATILQPKIHPDASRLDYIILWNGAQP